VEGFIAKGSFGAVWKAAAPDGRAFALKVRPVPERLGASEKGAPNLLGNLVYGGRQVDNRGRALVALPPGADG
jgi:hypothetical protein